jgi:MFS family permease
MRNRIKWILVGLGFTFGLQVLISLVYTAIAFSAARGNAVPQDTIVIAAFGFMLGAFLIGGFVVGWMSEEVRVLDSLIVAALTLTLTLLVYTALPSGNKGQFVSGYLLANVSRGALFVGLALVAAAIGAYWGSHVKVPQEGALDRVAILVGLVGAVAGPFVLLALGGADPTNPSQPNLPWYFLVIVILLVLIIVGVGFVLFTRESHYEDEISISPEHHKDEAN